MSVGVNLLFALTRMATSVLQKDFDVEIIEKHHRRKKDSPSGTALRIAEVVAQEKKVRLEKEMRCGRQGEVGERTIDEIGVHAVRGGDFVGEHTVIFAGDGEVVEIAHQASSRDVFAKGALRAAKWVAQQRPGLYDMGDVLGLLKVKN
jgi:4-hydroxy-tetrahydrodipicolinate reductase